MNASTKHAKPLGLRQSMSNLHIWTGLLAGWILYAVFLTGTLAFFRDETSLYMRPELPTAQHQPEQTPALAQRLTDKILAQNPGISQLSITLPTPRNPTATAMFRSANNSGPRGFSSTIYDPATLEPVQARATRGGDFFYLFHFNLHYMPALWARWLVGLCAMFMLVAIISGVITHKKIFTDFFTFRWGKGQRSWLDAHNALSVLGLPFHFMITWSGLITLMMLYLPWAMNDVFQTPEDRQQITAEMRGIAPAGRASGELRPLASIQNMVQEASIHWQSAAIGRITINHPGDAVARVTITPSEQSRVSTSPQFMIFDGVTGERLQVRDSAGAAAQTRGVLYGLHLGRFADIVTRWLYFLVSLAGTAMVGTGLVLWTVKRRAKLPDPAKPYFGFMLVERLNIATIAGLSVAVAIFFWCNRLLPFDMLNRANWEIHGFFIAWAGTLAWALLRPAKKAWVELLWLGALLLAALPVLNAITTDRHLLQSLWMGDWLFASFELCLLAFAAFHLHLASRTQSHQPKTKPARKTAAPKAAVTPTAANPQS